MLWCAMHDTRAEALSPFSERGFRRLAAAALSKTAPVADPDAPDTPSDFDLSPELVPGNRARAAGPGGGAHPDRCAGRVDCTADAAHRRAAAPSPGRSPFRAGAWSRPTAIRSPRRCARRRRRSASIRSFVEPLGYLDAYRTGTGFRIFPVVSFVREGFTLTARCARGGGCVRGAARLSDGRRQSSHRSSLLARDRSGDFTPCPSSSGTFGARRQV